ncbi:Glycoside hydrolase, superfamily [Metarhizium album ARSEF 1941]|uniref:Glycoside hydrolase, superfamily n=1 Tax=Metarhizium album (strain ARSEF 1941) TaxID=1081103 RepID=A0A0B2WFP9_METAS|nr:Glycoside hydrolase, superfamily [Metarhizium album ARSEF 1941]KHN94741.1 Glycoside hydrolase, superfamily [Metarhizium album ARSEF 1941]
MYVYTGIAAASLLAGGLAQDAAGWYEAHPGMPRIRQVNQTTHQIVDEYGRARFFHGTNVVMKDAPWYRPAEWVPGVPSFGEQDVRNMHDLGLNVVRLGHSWAGAEPARGQYNRTFLDVMARQTKLAEDHGIYVLVDLHQDVLARQLCGHGVPDWFVKKDWVSGWKRYPFPLKLRPFPVDRDGFPSPASLCNSVDWALSYTSVAVADAFGRLYSNHDGLGDAFAAYWKQLALVYADAPNVVGFNLMNEPWVGDHWADPTLLLPGFGDRKNLEGLWNRATREIRAVDKHTLIWFEGATLDILSGFNNVPLGDGSKAVHSYHYYKPPQLGSIHATLKNRRKDNERLRTAGVLTEFAFWMGDDEHMKNLADALSATDANMVSWIGWAYENLYNGSSGQPHPQLAKHYSRAYPAAVAGTPRGFSFDEDAAIFKLQFTADPTIAAPTEIILPSSTFPRGYSVQVSPQGSLLQHARGNRTLALFTSARIQSAVDVSVTVTRK